ncbi:MAG: hypothetical protein ACLTAG_13845 [Mediterraneibacter gnavus]
MFHFPQLIAGPIVKYHDIQKQIETRKRMFRKLQKASGDLR